MRSTIEVSTSSMQGFYWFPFQLFVYSHADRYQIEHSFLGHSNSGAGVIVTIAIS